MPQSRMARLTRADSQAVTRERLLQSAKTLFISDGYVATSVERIADAAGFSKGAVYSNFDSKEALFLVLVELKMAADREAVTRILAETTTASDLIAGLKRHYAQHVEVLDFTLVVAEFNTQVGRGSPFAAQYADYVRGQREGLGALIGVIFERAGKRPPAPLPDLAASLIGLTLGLSIQRGADREAITAELWARALEMMLKGWLILA